MKKGIIPKTINQNNRLPAVRADETGKGTKFMAYTGAVKLAKPVGKEPLVSRYQSHNLLPRPSGRGMK